jgi:hypothetical protein
MRKSVSRGWNSLGQIRQRVRDFAWLDRSHAENRFISMYKSRSSSHPYGTDQNRELLLQVCVLKWQEYDSILEILSLPGFGDDFQVLNTSCNRNPKLMGVDHAKKRPCLSLPPGGLGEQILIPREEYAS